MRSVDFAWSNAGYALVCAASREACEAFAGAYLRRNADVAGGVAGFISGYKQGFLQKKLTILELLAAQRPRKEQAEFRKQLEKHLAATGLDTFRDRRPHSMGSETLRRWSCLYAALTGTKRFVLIDTGTPQSAQDTARLAAWLQNVRSDCSIVWVSATDDTMALGRGIFPDGRAHLHRCRAMWRLEGDQLTAIDMDGLWARYQAAVEEENRRRAEALAAQMAKQLAEAKRLVESGSYSAALDICEKLIPQGSSEACMVALDVWERTALEYEIKDRAEKLISRGNAPEALIRLAKESMEAVHRHSDAAQKDEDAKSTVIWNLKRARDWYDSAAQLGSADACYEVAMLHLQYKFGRHHETGYNNRVLYREKYSYSHVDAIPYIKQLLAMNERSGGLSLKLTLLKYTNESIYEKAYSEYLAEKA